MNRKEILKPSWQKFALALIIRFLLFLIFASNLTLQFIFYADIIFSLLLILVLFHYRKDYKLSNLEFIFHSVFIFIFNGFIAYLISGLIIGCYLVAKANSDKLKQLLKPNRRFLMPDWRKILIFIVLLFLTKYLTICSAEENYSRTCIERLYSYYKDISDYLILSYNYNICPECLSCPCHYVNVINTLSLPFIIIWYLLSCFMVWIYYKLRKGRKK